ncbi:MAG: hypothetical protein IPJ88_13235 [Myxococcales bacterium]|nr:MAG: hypothetical protein IPJ88_13235 [Myxococcales bacterium]
MSKTTYRTMKVPLLYRGLLLVGVTTVISGCSAAPAVEGSSGSQQRGGIEVDFLTFNVFLRTPELGLGPLPRSNPSCRAEKIGDWLRAPEGQDSDFHFDVVALQESFRVGDTHNLVQQSNFAMDGSSQDVQLYSTELTSLPAGTQLDWNPFEQPSWLERLCFNIHGQNGYIDDGVEFSGKLGSYPRSVTNGGLSLLSEHGFVGKAVDKDYDGLFDSSDARSLELGSTAWAYCDCAGEDCLSDKGLVYAPIHVPASQNSALDDGIDLNVLTTHLQASGSDKVQVRERQLQTMVSFIEKRICQHPERKNWPTVLLGDLNVVYQGTQCAEEDSECQNAIEAEDFNQEYWSTRALFAQVSCVDSVIDVYNEVHGDWQKNDPEHGSSACHDSTLTECKAPPEPGRRIDHVWVMLPAAESGTGAWKATPLSAQTAVLKDSACAFESLVPFDSTVLNPDGYLSDYKYLHAKVHFTKK